MERKYLGIIVAFSVTIPNYALAESIRLDVAELSRLTTRTSSSANSITVLYREDIEQLGANNIAELLQYVPGITMARGVGNAYRISYLSGASQNSRGVGIKVDGISFYNQSRLGISKVDWDEITVDPSDIEKIEVIRSPDASEYGSDSFTAMINIVTRKISSQKGFSAAGRTDFTDKNNMGLVRYGDTSEKFDYLVSVKSERTTGIEVLDGDDKNEFQNTKVLNAKFVARPSSNQRINAQLSVLEGDFNYHVTVPNNPFATKDTPSDVTNYNVGINYRAEDSSNNIYEATFTGTDETARRDTPFCLPSYYFFPETLALNIHPNSHFAFEFPKNPFAQPAPGDVDATALQNFRSRFLSQPFTTRCGYLQYDNDHQNVSLELSGTHYGDRHTFTYGAEAIDQRVEAPMYFPGTESESPFRFFYDGLYEFNESHELRYGFNYEKKGPKEGLSYKIGALQHYDFGLSSKMVYSHGEQIAGIYDSQRHGHIPFVITDSGSPTVEPVFLFIDKADLKNEEIDALELIFLREGIAFDNTFELKLFTQEFRHQNNSGLAALLYSPTDDGKLKVDGIELDAAASLWTDSKLRMTYAYHEYDAEYGRVADYYGGPKAYETITGLVQPRNSGSLMLLQRFNNGLVGSISTVMSDEIVGFRLARYDVTLTYPFKLQNTFGKTYFKYRRYVEDQFAVNISDRYLVGEYENKDNFAFGFEINL